MQLVPAEGAPALLAGLLQVPAAAGRPAPREHLVEHGGEAPEVALLPGAQLLDDLGRPVAGRARQVPDGPVLAQLHGQPQVADLDVALRWRGRVVGGAGIIWEGLRELVGVLGNESLGFVRIGKIGRFVGIGKIWGNL